eukprot:scaffold45553_cov17-Tisochrysis_lutea.AAC.1
MGPHDGAYPEPRGTHHLPQALPLAYCLHSLQSPQSQPPKSPFTSQPPFPLLRAWALCSYAFVAAQPGGHC